MLDPQLMQQLTKGTPDQAWGAIISKVLEITRQPLALQNASRDVTHREREVASLDLLLAGSSWDLWAEFSNSVPRTSTRLIQWWQEPFSAKAVLILDGLSLRELPWLLQEAKQRGFALHDVSATAAELPGMTDTFARALGFTSRSQLQANGAGLAHDLPNAYTETVDMAWQDCANLINSVPNWLFWHQWPDSKLHEVAGAGQGLNILACDAAEQLSSDAFWAFVERLAQGRRLIITSDHGYAATGYFTDADGEVGQFLKKTFASGRSKSVAGDSAPDCGPFVPPVALQVASPHGEHLLALGCWKWKSQGGYPTLTHGGLSLLEVLSPFVELSKN